MTFIAILLQTAPIVAAATCAMVTIALGLFFFPLQAAKKSAPIGERIVAAALVVPVMWIGTAATIWLAQQIVW